MNWYAVYKADSGELVSTGSVVAEVLPAGLASVALASEPDGAQQWNPAARAFEPIPPESAGLAPIDFMRRFTMGEEAAIRAAARSDALIDTFLARLLVAKAIYLDHPETAAGINYLVARDLLTFERGAEILHG